MQITRNKYKKHLVSLAQAIEAHAFGEIVMQKSATTGLWFRVPEDWLVAECLGNFKLEEELK